MHRRLLRRFASTDLEALLRKDTSLMDKFESIMLPILKKFYTAKIVKKFVDTKSLKDYLKLEKDVLSSPVIPEIALPLIAEAKLALKNVIPDEYLNDPNFGRSLMSAIYDTQNLMLYMTQVQNNILYPIVKDKFKRLKDPNFDKPNDLIPTDAEKIDVYNREKPFVILDDKVYVGSKYTVHAQYINESNSNALKYCFGGIIDGIAFVDIDRTSENMRMRDIINLLLSRPDVKKVYTTPEEGSLLRLAKVIKPLCIYHI